MDSFVSSGIDGKGVFVIDDDGVCIDGRFFGYREIKTLSFAKEPDAQRVKATLRLETFKGSFEGYHILRDGQPTSSPACSRPTSWHVIPTWQSLLRLPVRIRSDNRVPLRKGCLSQR